MIEPVKPGQRLEIAAEAHPGGWLLRLAGVIDESFNRSRLVEGRQGFLVLDLDGVKRITSYGVREWVAAMSEAQGLCFFIRCRPAIVSQFNMVGNFAGRGQLVSLYAPYACTRCGAEFELLVDRRRRTGGSLSPSLVTCPQCQATAELDDIPETFFSYALLAPPPALPPLAAAIVDGPKGASIARLRVEKEVQNQVTVLWLSGPLDKSTHLKRAADGLEGIVVVVLAGISSTTSEGLSRFRQLAAASNVQLYLAAVPLVLARAFRRAPEALGNSRVLSIRVSFVCASCTRTVDIDADLAVLRNMLAEPGARPCPVCALPMSSPGADELRNALRLPLVNIPAEIRSCNLTAPSEGMLEGALTLPRVAVPLSPHAYTPVASSTRFGNAGRQMTEPHSVAGSLRRYEILRTIATGGMGTVSLGRVVSAGGFERLVAIKIMHPHIASDPSFVAMFLDEARLAARIRHSNVVATLDIDQTADGLFLVMEYIEGLTVRQMKHRIHRRGAVTPTPIVLRIMIDALAGLHAAHELTDPSGTPLQLVHRDVSPPNLLVGLDGITRMTDFGIARARSRLGMSTKKGEIKGKIGYMSPEQLRSVPLDRRSDVYATGVVLWELLTGLVAFHGDNEAVILRAALEGITRLPTDINPAVPPEISAVCMRALTQEAAWRHPTAAIFAEELESAAHEARLPIATTREVAALVKQLSITENTQS
jgi:DNA-directed RNA polymerase subunit RPC12/RpoP